MITLIVYIVKLFFNIYKWMMQSIFKLIGWVFKIMFFPILLMLGVLSTTDEPPRNPHKH